MEQWCDGWTNGDRQVSGSEQFQRTIITNINVHELWLSLFSGSKVMNCKYFTVCGFFEFAKIWYPQIIVTLRYGKDVCRWLYTEVFYAIIPTLFPCFLLFCYPYIMFNAFRTNYRNNNIILKLKLTSTGSVQAKYIHGSVKTTYSIYFTIQCYKLSVSY